MSDNKNVNLGQVVLTAILTTVLTFLVFKVYTDYQIKQYKTIIEKTLGINLDKKENDTIDTMEATEVVAPEEEETTPDTFASEEEATEVVAPEY